MPQKKSAALVRTHQENRGGKVVEGIDSQVSEAVLRATIQELCNESVYLKSQIALQFTHYALIPLFSMNYYIRVDIEKYLQQVSTSIRNLLGKQYISLETAKFLSFIIFVTCRVMLPSVIHKVSMRIRTYSGYDNFFREIQVIRKSCEPGVEYDQVKLALANSDRINKQQRASFEHYHKVEFLMLLFLGVMLYRLVNALINRDSTHFYVDFILAVSSLLDTAYSISFWWFKRNKEKQDALLYERLQTIFQDIPGVECFLRKPAGIWSSFFDISFAGINNLNNVTNFRLDNTKFQLRYRDIYKTVLRFLENTQMLTLRNFDPQSIIVDTKSSHVFSADDKSRLMNMLVQRNNLYSNKKYYLDTLNYIFQMTQRHWWAIETESLAGLSQLQFLLDLTGVSSDIESLYLSVVKDLFTANRGEVLLNYHELVIILSDSLITSNRLSTSSIHEAGRRVEATLIILPKLQQINDSDVRRDSQTTKLPEAKDEIKEKEGKKKEKQAATDATSHTASVINHHAIPRSMPTQKLTGIMLWPNYSYFRDEDPNCELVPLHYKHSDLRPHFFCYVDKRIKAEFSSNQLYEKFMTIFTRGNIRGGGQRQQGYTRWQKPYKNCHGVRHLSFFKVKDPGEDGRGMARIVDNNSRAEVLLCVDGWVPHTHIK